jgi:hypothetical protein
MSVGHGKVAAMPKFLVRRAAFLMLVMFLTNLGAWGYSGAHLAHEIDHIGKMDLGATAHEHDRHHDGTYALDDDDDSSVAAHQVLHAVDHLQFFPDTATKSDLVAAAGGVIPLHFGEQSPPLPASDLPFRPPRRGVLLA